ncbi:MAG TPA: M28 family peptidase [Verrucomicrobiae bacterium]|jgi:Zn-dependent M28 family amino/carboxypeptidase|nr:M28 family peptidase [Verrucomicrobiae bacterium]
MSPTTSGVTSADLKNRLVRIVGERSPWSAPARLSAVENYIEKEFAALGLRVESDPFSYRGGRYRNIIARTAARRAPLVVLGAHFDAVEGSPGADDNASGIAVLLEAARLLGSMRLKSEVLFCAFNLEELNMIGSSHLAKRLKAEGAKITGMVSLEMLGYTDRRSGSQKYPAVLSWFYPDRADFIGVIGNWRSAALLRSFATALKKVEGLPVETLSVLGNGFLVPQVRLSDHAPFWDAGYPALLLTDTAFMRNPHYHLPSDTIETLDLDFMAKVCRGVVNAVAGL